MTENSYITILELANIINVNKRTITRNISKLKYLNIISREGSDKNGYWVIKNKKEK